MSTVDPRIELINTGNELLLGQTLNTHTRTIGQALLGLGLTLQKQTTIPDGEILDTELRAAMSRADVVLVTGGLGPTSDDLTRPIVAKLFGRELILHPPTLEHIRERFRRRGQVMLPMVECQAMHPEGSEVLPNPNGTAPGIYMREQWEGEWKHVFLLPGPPRELIPMLRDFVLPKMDKAFAGRPRMAHLLLRTLGIGESHAQDKIEAVLREEFPGIEIGYCARSGEVDLRFILREGIERMGAVKSRVLELLGDAVWAEGLHEMEDVVVNLARERGATLATAESCTGGLVAHRLTKVSGASQVFLGGAVVYSNAEKTRQLGVPPEIISEYGAVSAECAEAMLRGLLERTGARHGVTTTGIAGPTGGTEEKPVGTCFIAATTANGGSLVQRFQLSRERDAFQYQASQHALNFLRLALM